MYQLLLSDRPPLNHGNAVKKVGALLLNLCKGERRKKRIVKLKEKLTKYNGAEEVATLYGMDISLKKVISYKAEWFGKPQFVEFEGRMMPIPTNADAYLSTRYGADYMQLPPVEKRKSYHNFAYVSFENKYSPSEK